MDAENTAQPGGVKLYPSWKSPDNYSAEGSQGPPAVVTHQPLSFPPAPQVVPAGHSTTVVVTQAAPSGQTTWSTGLCDCCDDCGICLLVYFCPCIAACQLPSDIGEFVCLCCCVPNWMTAIRTRIRSMLGIRGSICDDCCVTTCCGVCALCQMMREVKIAKQQGRM